MNKGNTHLIRRDRIVIMDTYANTVFVGCGDTQYLMAQNSEQRSGHEIISMFTHSTYSLQFTVHSLLTTNCSAVVVQTDDE